ncbi:hypothetical protein BDZ89DRAFT_1037628 [Hymenopellis radicata]|nr:hypothetical protein BDZ89DRAFT_1037628 [Hymenopellis radicata]
MARQCGDLFQYTSQDKTPEHLAAHLDAIVSVEDASSSSAVHSHADSESLFADDSYDDASDSDDASDNGSQDASTHTSEDAMMDEDEDGVADQEGNDWDEKEDEEEDPGTVFHEWLEHAQATDVFEGVNNSKLGQAGPGPTTQRL